MPMISRGHMLMQHSHPPPRAISGFTVAEVRMMVGVWFIVIQPRPLSESCSQECQVSPRRSSRRIRPANDLVGRGRAQKSANQAAPSSLQRHEQIELKVGGRDVAVVQHKHACPATHDAHASTRRAEPATPLEYIALCGPASTSAPMNPNNHHPNRCSGQRVFFFVRAVEHPDPASKMRKCR